MSSRRGQIQSSILHRDTFLIPGLNIHTTPILHHFLVRDRWNQETKYQCGVRPKEEIAKDQLGYIVRENSSCCRRKDDSEEEKCFGVWLCAEECVEDDGDCCCPEGGYEEG